METLIRNVFGWLFGKAGLLLVLIVAALCAPYALKVVGIARNFDPTKTLREVIEATKALTPDKAAPKAEIDKQVGVLRAKLAQKSSERDVLQQEICVLPTCSLVKSSKLYRTDAEIELLTQAVSYGELASRGQQACRDQKMNAKALVNARAANAALNAAKPKWAPVGPAHQAIRDRIEALEKEEKTLAQQCTMYKRLSAAFDGGKNLVLGTTHAAFLKLISELQQSETRLWASIKEVLPGVITAFLAIILMPIAVSVLTYFGVAPLAARGFGVRLLPQASGELITVSPHKDLQRIELDRGWELLIDPSLTRSTPKSLKARPRYLLDWSMPLSSIVTGLYLLTSIQSDSKESVTVAAAPPKGNPRTKIAVLELPENSALVLQPRCLVGIVQRIDRPIRITRHWRLASLSSWLTLQFRYVVFHGPARLIVKGEGGVEVESVQRDAVLNQAATLGFSANLNYGVARSEPFFAYYSGKKELFDDCFSGPGSYIQEVTLGTGSGAGSTRKPWFLRPLEVLVNTIFKALGLG